MIICPSCGSNFEGDLCLGCPSCGARAVGPPLATAEHVLRSYGRALGAATSGALMSAAFLVATIIALVQTRSISVRFSSILAAGETAAWRLKWLALPAAIVALWSGRRLIRSIKNSSDRFGGLRLARAGFVVSTVVTVLIATLIGITVPTRLERRQWGIEAGHNAQAYTIRRALLEYRDLHGYVPSQDDLISELSTLPDPDGLIAEALRGLDSTGYKPTPVVAAASTRTKSPTLRGGALRNAPSNNVELPSLSLSSTNYELRLPGEDGILGTDDDLIMSDGLIKKASDPPPALSTPTRH